MFFSSFFFFKQKTAYEMRISDWSSDVCSSDLLVTHQNMLKFVLFVDCVVDIQHCAAGITKHMVNTLFGQALHDDVGAIEFHIYSFRNQHWYSDRPLGPEL